MGECARFYRDHVPESVWEDVYWRLEESGRLSDALPTLSRCSVERWLEMFMDDAGRHPWVITFRDEIAGVVYLTEREGTCARIHFAFVPTKATRSAGRLPVPVAIGRFAVTSLLRDRDSGGGFALDAVVGVTPAVNVPALKMITRCGAVVTGTIPGLCRVNGHARNVPGVVTYFTRESTDPAWCGL
jgi:hypothetical protein